MIGDDVMSTREANIALLSKIPDIEQQRIFIYLTENFCLDNPFKAKSAEEIYAVKPGEKITVEGRASIMRIRAKKVD